MRTHASAPSVLRRVLGVALAIGLAIDAFVGIFGLFFQPYLGPLLDIPMKDPALTTIAGGEFIVVACVYAIALRDPVRYRALLWICALDQVFAALLPGVEIMRGNIAASWKTVGPIPLDAALAIIIALGTRLR